MRILLAFTLFTALAWSQPKKETGEINGARFRIDVPEKWNGGLGSSSSGNGQPGCLTVLGILRLS